MAIVEIPKGNYQNIPPNSFSSADIFRITAFHLTRIERLHIMYLYLVVIPSLGLVTDLIEIIGLLFKPTNAIMKILKFLRLYDSIAERINPLSAGLLLMVLPETVRIEAKRLIDVLKKEYYLNE